MTLYRLSAARLSKAFANGELSAVEITRSYLERIEALDGDIKAYLTVTADAALERAKKLDLRRAAGDAGLGALAAVPVAIKDNICVSAVKTTAGSRILEGYIPPYDATAYVRLHSAGCVMLGKTNMDEFAMGSSTENSGFFPTRNPWDPGRVPGGSSGGSAAAVAAEMCAVALGSDTGGSIRQPAALCGVAGLKPTYGRVSRYGLIAFASSLDQIGPLARDVYDCALVLSAIAGRDRRDATTAPVDTPDFTKGLEQGVKGLRLGIPRQYFSEGLDPEVRGRVMDAVEVLIGLGAEAEECSLPHTEYALSAYYLIAPAEASSNLARYDGVRYGYRTGQSRSLLEMYEKTRQEGFGPEVKRRIMLGTYALSSGYYDAYYLQAQKVRTLVAQDFQNAFAQFDLIVCPTAPTVAFRLGEKLNDPLAMYLEDVFTIPVNMAGLPGISIPCGLAAAGGRDLPVGLQLIGKPFDESTLLRAAYAFEKSTGYHQKRPPLGRRSRAS